MAFLRCLLFKKHNFYSLKYKNVFNNYSKQTPLLAIWSWNLCRRASTSSTNVIPFKLADIGEGIAQIEIVRWLVKEGDSIKEFDPICEAKSDKAAITISSRYTGVVKQILHNDNDLVKVGATLITIDTGEVTEEENGEKKECSSGPNFIATSPAVRKLAREYNVDLNKIKATGEQGRVTKGDILQFINNSPKTTEPIATTEGVHKENIEKIVGIRRTMFKTMSLSNQIPHMYFSDLLDATDFWKYLTKLNNNIFICNYFEINRDLAKFNNNENNEKISQLCFSVKAISRALSKYPILNSQMCTTDVENPSIRHQKNHNIGIAMDTPYGLVVPVVKEVQNKTIREIATEINELKTLARADKLAVEHISNGTFTISSLGNISGRYFGPCILAPQMGLFAIGAVITKNEFYFNDNCPKTYLLPVSIACDHRVIDGVTVAKFVGVYNEYLSCPFKSLLDSK